jgi:hypothetical protein
MNNAIKALAGVGVGFLAAWFLTESKKPIDEGEEEIIIGTGPEPLTPPLLAARRQDVVGTAEPLEDASTQVFGQASINPRRLNRLL